MSNLDFQNQLLGLAEAGSVLITETERFAHQLKWRYRLRQFRAGRLGWEPPGIHSFRSWLEGLWQKSWPDEWPAAALVRWRLLAECLEELPPPDPLETDIPLVLTLDESFETCLRYRIDPGAGEPANRLVEWRRAVWQLFERELTARGLFHPASLPRRLHAVLSSRPDLVSEPLQIVGFEFAGSWEREIIRVLCNRSGAELRALPAGEAEPRAFAFTDVEQELYGLIEDLTAAAARYPLHELAVVVLDGQGYSPWIAKHFEAVLGPPLLGDQSAYNLFPDRPLSRQPLFLAALLPFDFAGGLESRSLLLSLLRSPYYGGFARHSRLLAQWDWFWRESGVEEGFKALLGAVPDAVKAALPEGGLEWVRELTPFLTRKARTAPEWIGSLRSLWHTLEFPVLANELDQMAWQQCDDLLQRLETAFTTCPMDAGRFAAWLRAAADGIAIQRSGYEDAGIQVLGALEARGLAMSRVVLPGFVSGALPQPARSLPFLSADERKRVQGGTTESQFEFAKHLFAQFKALAPEMVLSRPMMNQAGDPVLPSPFWPAESEQRVAPVVPWRHGLKALQRARWVVASIEGVGRYGSARPEEDRGEAGAIADRGACFRIGPREALDQVSASALETLLFCPSRFFFQMMLQLEALPEIQRGLDPATRGQRIHEMLAAFGRSLSRESERSKLTLERLNEKLEAIVDETLAPYMAAPQWVVEKKRLLCSDEEAPGLLTAWLREEWARLEEGWEWIALETSFSDLRCGTCSVGIKGRLDRLDFHPEHGFICWDYKTGRIPERKQIWEELSSLQLPIYLLAVRKGLLRSVRAGSLPLAAGYIDLRAVRHLRHRLSIEASDPVASLLDQCEKTIEAALVRLRGGDLAPRWLERGCEEECPYECLCGLHLG